MSDQVWTLMEILKTAHRYLEEKGIESPRRNAEAMLGKVMGLARIDLYLQFDRPLSAEQVAAFRDLMRRRARREPLQLILGAVEFCGVTLDVFPGLLIPRQETEELADWVASEISKLPAGTPLRMLDIGSGTGCLSVAIAARVPTLTVDAVDIDFEAVRCTSRNAEANGVGERVQGILADVFSERFITLLSPPYDVMVSNPPYISESEFAGLDPEVRDHEAKHALVAADNGLAFYRKIAGLLPTLLRPDGLLAVEIGSTQGRAVAEILQPALTSVSVRQDIAGLPRIVTGRLSLEQSSTILMP
ncbi:MAG TPA: peptide chain release factor N(5)-glutamine methyltransferase [bacterium]|jgi:release factor glutamine methyltransferase